jgi:preprotein translocase subunit SecE
MMADAKSDSPAKVSPAQYVQQVRQEARKVVWPTARETYVTTVLVMIMVVIMGAFFFVVDWVLANLVQFVLGFGA